MKREPQAARLALQAMEREGVRRVRRTVEGYTRDGRTTHLRVDGRELVNFCSNDYLGLARDARVVEAMADSAQVFGAGSGAAHLVTGHGIEHQRLEETLADLTGRESALLFSTGYMANLGVITALIGRGGIVLEDRLNHASLIDGALLSGARLSRYNHNSIGDALSRLEKAEESERLIASDGVFSMDGDIAPLRTLSQLATHSQSWLVVDDAHGFGVIGREGAGCVAAAGLGVDDVPLVVGTLGKAFGVFGAFVAGPRDLIEFVLQRARSYVYTTALPPAVATAARVAVEIAREEEWRRERLQSLIARFREGASILGLPLMESRTAIQPIVLEDSLRCLRASQALRERGYWVAAIRPPTVPQHTARLRVTLSSAHDERDIDGLLDALGDIVQQRAA
ncbi:MAG: 8-amino-7-oxononanoate synthase [Steroidobacteraceae bacterium]